MDTERILHYLNHQGFLSFSRSSGPGGQNVNKLNTKALLRVSLLELEGVTEEERHRLLFRLQGRLTGSGDLLIQVQDERSQLLNREIAVDRLFQILVRALKKEKPRHATRPTRNSKERRLTVKRAHSNLKAQRKKRIQGDDS